MRIVLIFIASCFRIQPADQVTGESLLAEPRTDVVVGCRRELKSRL